MTTLQNPVAICVDSDTREISMINDFAIGDADLSDWEVTQPDGLADSDAIVYDPDEKTGTQWMFGLEPKRMFWGPAYIIGAGQDPKPRTEIDGLDRFVWWVETIMLTGGEAQIIAKNAWSKRVKMFTLKVKDLRGSGGM